MAAWRAGRTALLPRTLRAAHTPFDDLYKRRGPNECWIWRGTLTGQGALAYGLYTLGGRQVRAHRVAFERKHGKIPRMRVVMHSCDTPLCVNPAHLLLGTLSDNIRDMWQKGRGVKGEGSWNAKLTEKDIRYIRRMKGIVPQTELAKRYGVSRPLISAVHVGRCWKHV